jgi:hypothetical protein
MLHTLGIGKRDAARAGRHVYSIGEGRANRGVSDYGGGLRHLRGTLVLSATAGIYGLRLFMTQIRAGLCYIVFRTRTLYRVPVRPKSDPSGSSPYSRLWRDWFPVKGRQDFGGLEIMALVHHISSSIPLGLSVAESNWYPWRDSPIRSRLQALAYRPPNAHTNGTAVRGCGIDHMVICSFFGLQPIVRLRNA